MDTNWTFVSEITMGVVFGGIILGLLLTAIALVIQGGGLS